MLLSHKANNRFIKIISGNFYRSADYCSSKRNHRNICCSSANINYHISAWLRYINTSSNSRCDWFLYNINRTRTGLPCSIFHGLFFHLCNAAWHTNRNTRLFKGSFSDCLLYKMLNHFFCYCII